MSVKIYIIDSTNDLGKSIWEYNTTRKILEKSSKFKEWFKSIDYYKDFIEIGDAGYSGISNLMLSNTWKNEKDEWQPYIITINCYNYKHYFSEKINGKYLIEYIIDYL